MYFFWIAAAVTRIIKRNEKNNNVAADSSWNAFPTSSHRPFFIYILSVRRIHVSIEETSTRDIFVGFSNKDTQ